MASRDDAGYLVGLIGSGIGTSFSPVLHEREADALGVRYLYRILDLDELGLPATAIGDLVAAARLAGYHGLNITHPVKQLVLDHLDDLSPDAAAVGAVNTVVFTDGRAVGHNTDLTGFAGGFRAGRTPQWTRSYCSAQAELAAPSRTPCCPWEREHSTSSTSIPSAPRHSPRHCRPASARDGRSRSPTRPGSPARCATLTG